MSVPRKRVVCAWIADGGGDVLLTQRKAGTHLEHLWEFPGGKVEAGESDTIALARELREEIGIEAEIGEEMSRVEHPYAGKDGAPWVVELSLHRVVRYTGEVQALDVAAFRWVSIAWLRENMHVLPPADIPLLAAVA